MPEVAGVAGDECFIFHLEKNIKDIVYPFNGVLFRRKSKWGKKILQINAQEEEEDGSMDECTLAWGRQAFSIRSNEMMLSGKLMHKR